MDGCRNGWFLLVRSRSCWILAKHEVCHGFINDQLFTTTQLLGSSTNSCLRVVQIWDLGQAQKCKLSSLLLSRAIWAMRWSTLPLHVEHAGSRMCLTRPSVGALNSWTGVRLRGVWLNCACTDLHVELNNKTIILTDVLGRLGVFSANFSDSCSTLFTFRVLYVLLNHLSAVLQQIFLFVLASACSIAEKALRYKRQGRSWTVLRYSFPIGLYLLFRDVPSEEHHRLKNTGEGR